MAGAGGKGGGIDVTITLDDAALEAVLAQAEAGALDLRKPMGEIAEAWVDEVQARFAAERDPLGVPWKKRRPNPDDPGDAGRKVLHLTGALERAVIPEFGGDFAMVGVLKSGGPGKYAGIHNEGGTIVPREKKALKFGGRVVVMPRRQFLGLGPAEKDAAEDILGAHLRRLFSGTPA